MQFGCLYRRCSEQNFQCALHSQIASNNSCPNEEVQVRKVTLRPNFPVEFDLAVKLKGVDLDVVLLIDASESTKPKLDAMKNELISFVQQLNGTANVGVVVYGGENSFDEKGMTILSKAEGDIRSALNALENIPSFPDGPRTSLTALLSIQRYAQELLLRRRRTIIVLIGDTPGREPECSNQLGRDTVSEYLASFIHDKFSVISVSLGTPGLDAALPPIPSCANDSVPADPQGVEPGQASKIAQETDGEVVQSITATAFLRAVDIVRRKPNRGYQNRPGARIFISTETWNPPPGYLISYPWAEPRLAGCDDKVIVNVTGISEYVSEPAQTTGKVKLDLPYGICQSGPFNCTIRLVDIVRGYESLSHWPIAQPIYYKDIAVQAC
ncbi:von Willebrand factor A-like protein [Gracilaria domingensis]|nr:von Willebrand factor A-like protein [Gracilaria domingensis]